MNKHPNNPGDLDSSLLQGVKIAYLCLQKTFEGQASYAHVHEIIHGFRSAGATVDLFEPDYQQGHFPSPRERLLAFAKIQRSLKRVLSRYDVIYIRAHPFAYPTAKAARKARIPVVQECNGMIDDFYFAWPQAKPLSSVIRRLSISQYREAAKIIVGSNGLRNWLKRETGRDAHIVPNAANLDLFKPVPRTRAEEVFLEYAHPENGKLPARYALFFGSLAPWQGIETIMSAVSLATWPRDVQLLIIGDGALSSMVSGVVAKQDNITWLRHVPYKKIPALISGALCSLVVKEQEAFRDAGISPLKLYESLACGTPVIATKDMPGLTEVVQDNDVGVIVAQNDPAAIAAAVSSLNSDPKLQKHYSQRALEYATKDGSWAVRGARTSEIVRTVLDQFPSRFESS